MTPTPEEQHLPPDSTRSFFSLSNSPGLPDFKTAPRTSIPVQSPQRTPHHFGGEKKLRVNSSPAPPFSAATGNSKMTYAKLPPGDAFAGSGSAGLKADLQFIEYTCYG